MSNNQKFHDAMESMLREAVLSGNTLVPGWRNEIISIANDMIDSERKKNVIGATLIALAGFERQATERAKCFNEEPSKHPEVIEARRVIKAVKNHEEVTVSFENLCDVLAHAYQTLRIHVDEWERITKITLAGH